MRIGITTLGALVGVGVVAAVAPVLPVTVALALGATTTVLAIRRGRSGQYALAGSLFALGVAACVLTLSRVSGPWTRTPLVALVVFGGLSATLVLVRWLLSFVGKRVLATVVDPDDAAGVWEALSAFGSLLVITWSVLTAHEKALRTGGITIVGSGSMLLDALGYHYPVVLPYLRQGVAFTVSGYEVVIPAWLVRNGVDAPTVLFVGCVVIGFHTLETLQSTWAAITARSDRSDRAPAGSGAGPEPTSSGAADTAPADPPDADRTRSLDTSPDPPTPEADRDDHDGTPDEDRD